MALSSTNSFHYMNGGVELVGRILILSSPSFLLCVLQDFYFIFNFVLPEGINPREDSFSFPEISLLLEEFLST